MRKTWFVTVVMMALMLGFGRAQQPVTPIVTRPGQPAQPAPAPAPARVPARAEPAPAPALATVRVEPPAPGLDQPNVQFDIAISDEGGGFQPVKKNVVLLAQAGGAGSLRSGGVGYLAPTAPQAVRGAAVNAELNVDVKMSRYSTTEPNKIRARISIEYQPFSTEWKSAPGRVLAQVDSMLDSGKKTVLWQTVDPVSGLRSTLEVTATVIK